MGYKILGLNISIENDHLSGELIRGENRIYTKCGQAEFEIMRLVDRSEGNKFEGMIDLAGDIFFVADSVDKSDKFEDESLHRGLYFDIYLNDIQIYGKCKMIHFNTILDRINHRGVQVAHFRAMRGIDIDKLLELGANEEKRLYNT